MDRNINNGKVMSKNLKKISLQINNCCDNIGNIQIDNEYNDKEQCNNKEKKNGFVVDKKEIARRRWGLLAKALKSPISSTPSSPTDEISLRRFSTFSLITPEPLEDKSNWYKYSTVINGKTYYIEINHLAKSFTAADLMGFNNTGNLCVWPSEESLAYYILHNLDLVDGKSVLELGAGMSALAGLITAKYSKAKKVLLTDGNSTAVENIQKSLTKNPFPNPVSSKVLKWNQKDFLETYDVILSADCLFFDEARNDLIEIIYSTLAQKGFALVMAPRRGGTLEMFYKKALEKGFDCIRMDRYNEVVWNKHLEYLRSFEYDEDIHYPILLKLIKKDF